MRRQALIAATIAEVGARGSLDVTVSAIARRAGVSAALAHHYFGSKEALFVASMRAILTDFGRSVRRRLVATTTPAERLAAIVEASFDPEQCTPEMLSAWLTFYLQAQTVPEAARLLRLYRRRLHSNLMHALRPLMPEAEAAQTARILAALIDGLYIRHAPAEEAPPLDVTRAAAHAYLESALVSAPARADAPEALR